MRERPVLFSGPMIRAILEGRKTMTRRVVKGTALDWLDVQKFTASYVADRQNDLCPYGKPGDQLWVRESGWQPKEPTMRELRDGADTWPKYEYSADGLTETEIDQFKEWGWKSRPSIFMPRWASRITLEITGVRVERLRDISDNDAIAEGAASTGNLDGAMGRGNVPTWSMNGATDWRQCLDTAREAFCHGWNKINGKRPGCAWADNPWVWVIEFKRITD